MTLISLWEKEQLLAIIGGYDRCKVKADGRKWPEVCLLSCSY